jgi:hypothetical protein
LVSTARIIVQTVRTFRVVAITLIAFLLAILVLSYAFVRSEGLSARKKPSNFEYAIANCLLDLSIPSEAKKLRNPFKVQNPKSSRKPGGSTKIIARFVMPKTAAVRQR